MNRVVGAILAAGASLRLGRPKQLVAYGGSTLVGTLASEACASRLVEVAVIVGAEADAVTVAVSHARGTVAIVTNDAWEEGMASSVRAAAAWAAARDADAVLLMVCDQPRLTAAHVDRLIAAYAEHGGIVASAYGGALGVPAVFPRETFAALGALRGAEGARRVVRDAAAAGRAIGIEWPDGVFDVDTPDDVARLGSATPAPEPASEKTR